jgi:type IVB pilus formation R64 PilN family outer membrane protein
MPLFRLALKLAPSVSVQGLAIGCLAALMLAGCETPPALDMKARAATARIEREQAEFRRSLEDAERRRILAQEVTRPYIAGNSRPLAREVAMPSALRQSLPVTALYQRTPVDLETALRQLTEASGLLFSATSDALLPVSAFAPRTGGGAPSSPVQPPVRVVLRAEQAPLWSLLDDLARQASLSWRPVPGGAEFYRIETRSFTLAGQAQVATTHASLGRNAGQNAVFESQSRTAFEAKDLNPLRGLLAGVEAMLSTGGRAQLAAESQTLVVTDTPPVLDRISRFIDQQNRSMSRRVRVMLEVIEVVDRDASDIGVDWHLIYASAHRALSHGSHRGTTAPQGALFSVGPTAGPLAGSALVVNALNEVGVVINRRVFPFLTTSGRPVTQALRSTFNYVDQVQATQAVASSAGGLASQAPTVTQKEETVGTFVTMVPTAKDDDTIFLSLSFDLTSAQPLVPFTVGSAGSSVTVQQKTIEGTGFIQEVPIRSGQTVLVGGIEAHTDQHMLRRLAPGASLVLGGSDSRKRTRSRMLLLVTAIAEQAV